ncbi:olfactory receptor-like protein OLF3 [Monodelphis domestica]|uniref:olfactory receptor-like protein OLF3 n=1 Tax=Monodelphis domestica TaxID=13616 RepID=UPI00020F75F8|nr:olfactory receptor-like protein OLF3 [Monodelphis domestica]
MGADNVSWVNEFILLGLSTDQQTQTGLFVLFGATYLLTLLGNGLIILLIWLDSRLHSPMYFFLCNLSVVDIFYTTSGVPQMLAHFLMEKKTISYTRCATQLFFSLALGGIEFLLLAAMAYDRYVAVCDPLQYVMVMHRGMYVSLAIVSWLIGLVNSAVETAVTVTLPTCGRNVLNHVACETLALVRMACVDITINQIIILISSVIVLLVPCCLVSLSYAHIVAAILRIRSTEGRRKAFGTCTSHLTVVSMSYGMALFTYMQPRSSASAEQDKMVVLFYAVVTPMLNPLIYSLRNKDMKAALRKVIGRSSA